MSRFASRLIAAALLALPLPAAAATLHFGLAEDADALDPTLSRTFSGRMIFAALCDKLVDIGPDLKIVPQLATTWDTAPDGKTMTMTLRPGVTFHDGEPLDAAAAKYSIERHLRMPGSQRRSEIAPIDSVEVVDALTFKIHLKQPFAPLLAQFADRAGMMVAPQAAERLGAKFATAPVCAGPFKFVERVPQSRIVVERFPDYWNRDQVHLDRIEFQPIPDATVRLTDLRAGQLDLIERVSPTDLPQIARDPRLKIGSALSLGFEDIRFTSRPGSPLADPRVREAFDLSIDRNALNQVVFGGQFVPGNQWVAPSNPDYVTAYPLPKRDIKRAKALLAAAGTPAPAITLMIYADNISAQVGQVVQAMVKEADFVVKLQSVEFTTALDLALKGQFEAYLAFWSGRPDPDGNTYIFLSCEGSLNNTRYCNADADAALDAERATGDPAGRRAAWARFADRIMRDRPTIYLFHPKLLWAYAGRLTGFGTYPDGLVRFTGLELH